MHIHTIPILDALREPGSCAFCTMTDKLENDMIRFMLGPAYMEDDVRMQTNKIGFCKPHMNAMYKEQNRLGLGLMLHTHMKEMNEKIAGIIKERIPIPFFAKDSNAVMTNLAKYLSKMHNDCYICKKIADTFGYYLDTFFMLWRKGGDDAKLIKSQKSYCIPHFISILEAAEKRLSRSQRESFADDLLPVYQAFQEMEADLEWFTLKFDFRNKDEPWKNSKDSLPRAIDMLGGRQ